MTQQKETVAAGGVDLFVRRSEVANPRGTAILLHGYGDHSGRYPGLTELFNRLGLSVYLYDQRGHGRSGGRRGTILAWDEYLDDLQVIIDRVTDRHGGPPETIFGHSMGGLVTASYLLRRSHPFRRAVLSSPLFALAVEVGGLKLAAGKLLSRLVPTVNLPTEIKPEMISRDPLVAEAYATDPLVHRVANVRWYTEHLKAEAYCCEHASELAVDSLLALYGTGDELVSPTGTDRFFAGLTLPDRKLIAYPDLRHEVFHELNRDRPLSDLEAWLGERI